MNFKITLSVLLMLFCLSLSAQENAPLQKTFISWDQFHKDTISLEEELIFKI